MSETIDRIVDVIGLAKTIDLLAAWGGREIGVPRPENLCIDSPIALVIGRDSAYEFCKEFYGMQMHLPAERNLLIVLRRRQVVADYRAGERNISRLALTYGVSRRQVHRYLAECDERTEEYGAAAL